MEEAPVLNKELLRQIRRVQIRTKHLVESLLAGAYRSAFKGQGMELADVRAYQPGDEVRHIDWNVTARMGQPFVKTYQEERELTVMLVVDLSASSKFGSQTRSKQALMAEIGAVLAFSAVENNDRIGLLLFTDRTEKYLPPKRGVPHAMRVVRDLLAFQPEGKETDIRSALSYLARVQRRRCTCFLLSDFITDGYQHALRVAAKRYDLIAIRVRDPREIELPKLRTLSLRDLETGQETTINSSSTALQRLFNKSTQERAERQKHFLQQLGAGFIDINTQTPYEWALRQFFEQRRKAQIQ